MRRTLLFTLALAFLAGGAIGQGRDAKIRRGGKRDSEIKIRSRLRASQQEEQAREFLRAEEKVHRLRLARLARLNAVALEQGWNDQLERLRLLALAEKERHALERIRLRRQMRDELFWELEEELVVGRLRSEPAQSLPQEMQPVLDDMVDAKGVRIPNRGPKTVYTELQDQKRRKSREEKKKRRAYERFKQYQRQQAKNQSKLPNPDRPPAKIRRGGGGKRKARDQAEGSAGGGGR